MLLELTAAIVVCLLAFGVIVKASVSITRRLGLDPMAVLLYLGLAEEPQRQRRAERRRLRELLPDQA